MKRHHSLHNAGVLLLGLLGGLILAPACAAKAPLEDPELYPAAYTSAPVAQPRGVLDHSHAYHQQAAAAGPSAGWYKYGFGVNTYRWGWFGASRYYPRVVYHRDYGDTAVRWAYRQGY